MENKSVVVSVPYEKELTFTLYVKGAFLDIPKIDDSRDFLRFKIVPNTAFVLFYTFDGFRRAYIVTNYTNSNCGEPINLPCVDQKLTLILKAKGRKVDHLKRAMYLFSKKDEVKVFSFPLIFWYKLAGLIEHFGAKKSDLFTLYNQYLCEDKNANN